MKNLLMIFLVFAFFACSADSQAAPVIAKGDVQEVLKMEIEVENAAGETKIFTATLEDNSSVAALVAELQKNEITLAMSDYGSFEKSGNLEFSLPRNDKHFSTDAGDVILYQGRTMVLYYDKNSYSFTKLGFIDEIANGTLSKKEFQNFLGSGDVKVIFRLKENK